MREDRVGLACHLYCHCCVGVARRCDQGVHVHVKTDAQRRPVDVQTMGIGCVLWRAENTGVGKTSR
jgi:hypothetical protein